MYCVVVWLNEDSEVPLVFGPYFSHDFADADRGKLVRAGSHKAQIAVLCVADSVEGFCETEVHN